MKNAAMTFNVNFKQLSFYTPIHLLIRWWRSGQFRMFLCNWILVSKVLSIIIFLEQVVKINIPEQGLEVFHLYKQK